MKRKLLIRTAVQFLSLSVIFLTTACTDLEIEGTDSVITDEGDGIFNGVENIDGSLNNLYNNIYGQLGNQADFFALNEVSTDEMMVPTRGTDWGDNGIWRQLHAHNWIPAHQYILNTWNNLNQNVFRATEIIDPRSTNRDPEAAASLEQVKAEAKFLRAFSMFFVLDLWGVAPFREPDEGSEIDPKVFSNVDAYNFILQDLTEAIPDLPTIAPSDQTDRASKAAANFLLAKLHLNAHRYNGTGTPDVADMNAVIAAVEAIEADGFALESGTTSEEYFNIFTEAVDNETIWFARTSVGNRIWNGMHYNQTAPENTGGGWNGFTTLSEFYDLFEGAPNSNYVGDAQEPRRGWVPDDTNADDTNLGIGYGFLIGQQYDAEGNLLNDRTGVPLEFTRDFPGLSGNNERTGIRVIKYHPANDSFTNHEIVFRYADAHLMKAEAVLRGGTDPGGQTPMQMVNDLRNLRGAMPLASATEQDLIDERGRELYIEFWRRNDLIRFGQYTKDWQFKDPGAVGDATKELYPIPTNALLSNPNLVQNPGY